MSATALNTHMLGHSGERPFICTLCGYSSKQVGHLKKDMLIHSGERSFKCTQRNHWLKAWLLTKPSRHLRSSSGTFSFTEERSLNCVTFATILLQMLLNLKTHKLMHSGGKPFACDQCEYSTTRRHHLKTHKLTHSGKKPFHSVNILRHKLRL